MTGAEIGSVTKAGGIGWASSSAGSCVAVVRIAGQSAPLSYTVHFNRHLSRTASSFTIEALLRHPRAKGATLLDFSSMPLHLS
jgi:hypothetical protein